MSSRSLVLALAALALVALVLRTVRLDERPPHTDEAVNAWILGRILAGEPFAFDPRDRHGPLLPAAGLAVATIRGCHTFAELDERTIRLAPAIIGAAATGLFALGAGLIPNGVLAAGAALWAFAPLPLYYARYAIHETLLVAATLLFLLSLARACRAGGGRARAGWAALSGAAAGAMIAAKLSALVPIAAAAGALAACLLAGTRATPATTAAVRRPTARTRHVVACIAPFTLTAVFVVLVAYTWGFTRWAGLHDLLSGLAAPVARAAGQGHEKGPLYFLEVLGHGSFGIAFLLAALTGAVLAWRRGATIGRALVLYAAALLLIHSAIPYKTPWLALGLFLPLATLAGWAIAAALALRHIPGIAQIRIVAGIGLTAFAALTARADLRLVFCEPAAEANPLAYAHTSADLRRLEPLVASLPGPDPLIAVYLDDPWPLPFLLRHHARVGYWQPGQPVPTAPDLVITTPTIAATLDTSFANWRPHYFSQRPGVMLVALQAPCTEGPAP